ncbi:MAG: response regulator transcription factor [Negativicutes bacterium]|nr:response regulator transcription factor [Negativicutes bacterium]
MKLLLVEDESRLVDALSHLLKRNGFVVDRAADGDTGIDMAATGVYDIIVLDRMLPNRDGLFFLKEYRSLGFDTPVLILTAKDSPEDRVEGLDAGADDYLVKPFCTEELIARLRALLRRQSRAVETNTIAAADLVLYPLRGLVKRGNETIPLTTLEAQILELLMRNNGHIISTERILERVWGQNSSVYVSYVHLYIHYLRKKLKVRYIKTIQKIGYQFLADEAV